MPIVEVAGWPGSGKTSYLIELTKSNPNYTIFIDCEGSLASRSSAGFPRTCDLYRIHTIHELIALLHQQRLSKPNALVCIDGIAHLFKGSNLSGMHTTKILSQLMLTLHKLTYQFQLQIFLTNTIVSKGDGNIVSSLGPVFARYFDQHIQLGRQLHSSLWQSYQVANV